MTNPLLLIPQPWRRRALVAGGAVLVVVIAFVAGRYSAPTKIETRTEWKEIRSVETQWLTRVEYQDRTKIRTRIVTVERVAPDGSRETTRTEDSGTDVAVNAGATLSGQSTETTASNAATVRKSETSRPGWALGVSGLWDPGRLSPRPERLTLELDRRLVGTVWLGLRASAEPDLGAPRVGVAARVEW